MGGRRFLLVKAQRMLAGLAVSAIALRVDSGVPATWKLRRIARSRAARRACAEAEDRLRARLSSIAHTYSLRPVFTQTIDQCSRGSRLDLGLDAGFAGDAALTGHLRIVAYFETHRPFAQAIPEIIGRLPPLPLYAHRDDRCAPKPKPDSTGPHLIVDGTGHALLDWDIPGHHLIAPWVLTTDWLTLRQRVSTDPAGMTPDRARQAHGPLLAWTVSTHYLSRPKRTLPHRSKPLRRRRTMHRPSRHSVAGFIAVGASLLTLVAVMFWLTHGLTHGLRSVPW
ncbi:hypothetical protein [Streptacidiphilus sp. EB129]|uniref:hypothetical protein n=1 Tax=Streptacidiphilus sp. EB129 TaxID=3156262 RepID=UPI003517353D